MTDIQLTKNFRLAEMCHTDTGLKNEPDEWTTEKLLRLCQRVLQPCRDAIGVPMKVNSAYRSPLVNQAVGGVGLSQHLFGEAADIYIEDEAKYKEAIQFFLEHKEIPWRQLLTCDRGKWFHISIDYCLKPRHFFRRNHYK